MPDIHDHNGRPGGKEVLRVVIGNAEHFQRVAQKADVDAAEDLPDRAEVLCTAQSADVMSMHEEKLRLRQPRATADPGHPILRTYAGANEWRTLPSFASPPSARKGQATPAVGDTWWDKSLFSFAGFTADGVTAELWAFELQDLTWRHLQPQTNLVRRFANGSTTLEMGAQTAADVLPSPRVYSALVQHDGGTLVMFGGLSEEVQGVGRVALGDVWSLVKSAWLDRFHGIRAQLGTQSDICRVCHSLQVPRTSRLKPMS